ncbi:GNAT family N-acetyltransferase [Chelativorans xinjiangense]|uniref:GNAT family N-acetyltransferase n=1 Tax=Chelativorans xinjiangense TaxID=2681485 RepID=UPI001356E363|nr:N-acetyltransferase [Chelativorans xinjiangense]
MSLSSYADGRGVRSTLPPSTLSFVEGPGISPTRGEIGGGYAFAITPEAAADAAAREALLDRAMGPKRKRKSSEKLRRGRLPAEGLAFVARGPDGSLVGTVRLWDVRLGETGVPALLLGPLAVDPAMKGEGIGTALMGHAVGEAKRRGHGAILLVGDAPYYARFGFSAEKTGRLSMPGPYERERFLALELVGGALDGAHGVLKPARRNIRSEALARAA